MESSSSDLNGWEPNCKECNPIPPCRKGRLFKTRAESNKKNVSNLKKLDKNSSELSKSTEVLHSTKSKYRDDDNKLQQSTNSDVERCGERLEKKLLRRSASQEVISTKRSLASLEFQVINTYYYYY